MDSCFFFLSFFFFFFHRLISELAERNSTKLGHTLESKCNLKTYVQNVGYLFPLQIGGPKHLFRRLRNLTVYIFGMKQDIDNRASALTTTKGLLHCLKTTWTLVHKQLQTGPPFLPTLRKFCILFHCQASHTEISKRNSTTLCQTVQGQRIALTIYRRKVGVIPPEKNWGQTFLHLFGFRQFGYLMVNICWTKRDIDNRATRLKYEGSPTLSQNFMSFGPQMA